MANEPVKLSRLEVNIKLLCNSPQKESLLTLKSSINPLDFTLEASTLGVEALGDELPLSDIFCVVSC